MVTDDPTTPDTEERAERRTLEALIAESPAGFEPGRVLRWADQLALLIDLRHEQGYCCGAISPATITIDQRDVAQLEEGPAERDLLLGIGSEGVGAGADQRERDVRALAAALYVALGGSPDDVVEVASEPPPIRGVSVQINLALLAALSPDGRRPATARALVEMLRSGPVPGRWLGRASRRTVRVPVAAGVALGAVAVAILLWRAFAPADARLPPRGDEPRIAEDLLAIEREMRLTAAQRSRRRWESVVAEEPVPLFERLRPEAEEIKFAAAEAELLYAREDYAVAQAAWDEAASAFRALLERHHQARRAARDASRVWDEALASAPAYWLDVDEIGLFCAHAAQSAEAASAANAAGRFEEARRAYERAVAELREASALHAEGVSALLAEAEGARDEGRFDDTLIRLERVEPFRDPEEISRQRIETYLAIARARNTRSTREEAQQAIDALLALDPRHPEGLALGAALSAQSVPRHGEIFVNTLSQTLVYVGPGRFDMGSPPAEPFRKASEQRHRVELSLGFWLGRVEVTRGQFAAFVEATGHVTDAEAQGWSHGLERDGRWRQVAGLTWRTPGFYQSDNHPVVCVSYNDAQSFCRWLSDTEGRTYRLPTEAEWEYACRAGTNGAYSWGDNPFDETARANAADVSWTSRIPDSVGFPWFDGYVFTSPVAGFPANTWGLFDMDGNVREWCLDVYGPYDPDEIVDPLRTRLGTAAGDRAPRVLRGGSFASVPADCRAAHRDASKPAASFVTVGFRVVMEEEER